jgi:hypothetical protein
MLNYHGENKLCDEEDQNTAQDLVSSQKIMSGVFISPNQNTLF